MKKMFPLFDIYAKSLLTVALLSRVSFAALAVIISLKTENGFLVSPFVEIPFGDYNFYLKHASQNFVALKEPFIFFYQGGSVDSWLERPLAPGPLFPWLLNIFNYPKQPCSGFYLPHCKCAISIWLGTLLLLERFRCGDNC